MTSLPRLLFGAALCASLLLSSTAAAQVLEQRNFAAESTRFIVEFHGVPVAQARGTVSASAYDTVFARFRADLAGTNVAALSAAPRPSARIAHEYRAVFFGAAIEADSATIERVRALPYVRAVHPDRLMHASASRAAAPLDTIVDARTKVNASSLGTSGAGIVVAVLDSGIDYMHPALGGGLGAGFKVAGGYDFINQDADPMDDNGHGTHVAGIIAASASDLIGVAPDVTLIGYKVLNAAGSGETSGIIAAIERCVDPNGDGNFSDRVAVANLSLGGPGDAEDPGSRAVDNAVAAGVVMVVAAGNDGGMATIGSPGTAIDALTVAAIDDGGSVTSFSSRGPSPRLLGFKPDVAAPGFGIVSAQMGGGTIALNGTSMATPHVAGVAALLRKLHPDWTPAQVKAAVTSSATEIDDAPFSRGAGRVDARAAHESTLLISASGLSFGIRPSRTGTTTATQTFRITNRGSAQQSLNLSPGSATANVTVRITPPALQLAPGATGDVSVEVETNDAALAFPSNSVVGGDVRISGTSNARLAWAFLRTARARMTFDGFATSFNALGPGGARGNPIRDPHAAEVFLTPGARWDFVLSAYDAEARAQRLIVKSDVAIDGDHLLEFRMSDAALELVLDSRDENNASLASRSAQNEKIVHLVGSRIFWGSGADQYSFLLLDHKKRITRLMYSPLPGRFQLYHFEQFVDFEAAQSYTIEHTALTGLAETKTLSTSSIDLSATTVRRSTPQAPQTFAACAYDALTSVINTSFAGCLAGNAPSSGAFVHRATPERFPLAHAGMLFLFDGAVTQALRGRVQQTVVSSQITAPPTAELVPDGGTLFVDAAPAHPFALPGTRVAGWFRAPLPSFYSASGDLLHPGSGMNWTTFDASGMRTASGVWRGGFENEPPVPTPQSTFVATRQDLRAAGGTSQGTLEVKFSANTADLNAPTLTSLRVIDAQGRTTDRLNFGEAAALRFSAVDVDYTRGATSLPSRLEATKAWYRVAGTETWQPLSVAVIASESGSIASLGHFPSGDRYEALLNAATATRNVLLDLRVEFADPAGNTVRWTQERALSVGNPPEAPRRRAARK
jgi:subtilisin family serine protease